jgi:hypothetical protein
MRIFGLGLSRTGTSSLASALQMLGYAARHHPEVTVIMGRLWQLSRRELRRFDAFTDIPVIPFYKQLDVRYPGSKFILTLRDVDAWVESCRRYRRFQPGFAASRKALAIRRAVYGTERFDADRFRAVYQDHVADVRMYFRERKNDLLEMSVCDGEGWEKLCPFLGLPIPDAAFPHVNVGGQAAAA